MSPREEDHQAVDVEEEAAHAGRKCGGCRREPRDAADWARWRLVTATAEPFEGGGRVRLELNCYVCGPRCVPLVFRSIADAFERRF